MARRVLMTLRYTDKNPAKTWSGQLRQRIFSDESSFYAQQAGLNPAMRRDREGWDFCPFFLAVGGSNESRT